MRKPFLTDVQIGKTLIPIVKHINQEKINEFSVTTGAVSRVHVDPEYCRNTPLKTTLANGYLSMAYISEMMEVNFGQTWGKTGDLEIKFINPVRPQDSVMVEGVITGIEISGEDKQITCDVQVINQNGDTAVAGSASLSLSCRKTI